MKVSKKRLIEIVTEEISRVRKEARWQDEYSHVRKRDYDKEYSPRRRRRAPEPTPSAPSDTKFMKMGLEDGVDAYTKKTNEQPRKPSYNIDGGRPSAAYVHGWFVGWVPKEKEAETRSQRLRSYDADAKTREQIDDILARKKARKKSPIEESFRFMSKNQIQAQINQAEIDGDDDGRLTVWYPEDITANEAAKFMYGHSSDPKYWGDSIRVHPDAVETYWAWRKEASEDEKEKQ